MQFRRIPYPTGTQQDRKTRHHPQWTLRIWLLFLFITCRVQKISMILAITKCLLFVLNSHRLNQENKIYRAQDTMLRGVTKCQWCRHNYYLFIFLALLWEPWVSIPLSFRNRNLQEKIPATPFILVPNLVQETNKLQMDTPRMCS